MNQEKRSMDNSIGAPGQDGSATPSDTRDDLLPDESTVVLHPRHQLARSVTSMLRMVSLFLLVGGVGSAVVWRFDFRQPGALHGSGSGIVVGLLIGSALAAALIAALAFVVDLLFRIDWDAKFAPVQLEECP
jgi:hypothetical protein